MGPGFPLSYSANDSESLAFLPFVIAPLSNAQDTVILGPEEVHRRHHEFIDRVYRPLEGLDRFSVAVRRFQYRRHDCLSVSFVRPVADQDRHGAALSVGFLVPRSAFSGHKRVGDFLLGYLNCINEVFGVRLPSSGASQLIQLFSQPSDQHEVLARLSEVKRSVLLASMILSAQRDTVHRLRWPGQAIRRLLGPRAANQQQVEDPALVLHPRDASKADLMVALSRVMDKDSALWSQDKKSFRLDSAGRRATSFCLLPMSMPGGRQSKVTVVQQGLRSFLLIQ